MNKKCNIAILLTAYNEEKVIGSLVKSIPAIYDIYVVDDGSFDQTARIATENGARVISLPVNVGQGAAAIVGYKIIAQEHYEYLVKLDGDGQHNPAEIPLFIEKFEKTDADTVVGSRILGMNYKEAPLARRLFLRPLNRLINKITGYNLTDTMCGFRAFRGKSLKKIIKIFDQILEPEYMASEMWIRFSNSGIKVSEVPVHLEKRRAGFSYKGLFRYGYGIAIAIIRTKIDLYNSRS